MRSVLALSLLLILCGSADAATVHHSHTYHHVAAPSWVYASPRPQVHYDDTPSYDDPSKFGGSEALPVEQ